MQCIKEISSSISAAILIKSCKKKHVNRKKKLLNNYKPHNGVTLITLLHQFIKLCQIYVLFPFFDDDLMFIDSNYRT